MNRSSRLSGIFKPMNHQQINKTRGYFEIGIYQGKHSQNLGILLRSAYQMGASGIFTIGKQYLKHKQKTDTYNSWKHIPLREFETFEQFKISIPFDCALIGIETGGERLTEFKHPQRAIYLLGTEDSGLPDSVLEQCQKIISLDAVNNNSYNVAIAGSIVMYHRQYIKTNG